MLSNFRHTHLATFLASILLVVFAYQVVNKALFIHSHKLEDGTIVIHAHPFPEPEDAGPVTNHTHTAQIFRLLDLSYHMLIICMAFMAFAFISLAVRLMSAERHSLYVFIANSIPNNKAPPCLS